MSFQDFFFRQTLHCCILTFLPRRQPTSNQPHASTVARPLGRDSKTPFFLIGLDTPTTTTHLNIHLFKWAERHSCCWHALQREGTVPPNQRLKLSHTKADTHDVATFLRNVRPPVISSVSNDSQGTITVNSGHACRFWTNFGPISSSVRTCAPQMHSEPCHNNFGNLLTAIAMIASFPVPSFSLRTLNSLREQTSVTINNLSSLLGNIGAQCLPLVWSPETHEIANQTPVASTTTQANWRKLIKSERGGQTQK